jgi:hypothetical protein
MWRVLTRVPLLRGQSFILRLQLAVYLLRALMGIDFYRRVVTDSNVLSVLTLCDAHSNEYVLTKVARSRGIRTATLQHGLVDVSVTPVSSEYMFVWGDAARSELRALGVPDEQIVVVGRPGLDEVLRKSGAQREALRREFTGRYGVAVDKPIVMYFATNWGRDENRGLFSCFAACRDLPLTPVIKLKSNAIADDRKQYHSWLAEFGLPEKVPIITAEPLWDCLNVADVIVTCHSSAAVEALPFGTVVIVLDIYPHMELEATLPHYHDVIVVKSAEELKETLSRLTRDQQYYETARQRALNSSRRFLANSPHGDAAGRIAAYLRAGERSWQCG